MGRSKAIAGVPVSKRALVQRINRKLAKDDEVVKATRGDRGRAQLGDFYRVNVTKNFIIEMQIDLEELGRELGVLQPYERLEEDGNA